MSAGVAKMIAAIKRVWQKLARHRAGFREVAIMGLIYGCYRLTISSLGEDAIMAFQNAYYVLDMEKELGLFVELDIQAFFLDSTFLIHLVNSIYTFFYYPALILFAVWAFNRHREQYYFVRNIFIVSAALAFISFSLFPVAPPRLMPLPQFVDTMVEYGVFSYGSPASMSTIANPYAAMPSLHFGWTLLIGGAIMLIARPWWAKCLGAVLPTGMLVAIIATGNHFILDAVGGGATIIAAYLLVRLFHVMRERRVFSRQASISRGMHGGRM